jgi:hypothetical protein
MFMKDRKEFNKLIQTTEYDKDELRLAFIMALDDFNSSPPQIGLFNFETFPSPVLLLTKAAINALDMGIFQKDRDRLPYNDSGLSVDDDGQSQAYTQHRQILVQEYEAKKKAIKVAMNVEGCYGGSSSEYGLLSLYTNRTVM